MGPKHGTSTDPTVGGFTSDGARISGDATSTYTPPLTMHIEGAVVCGTTTTSP